MKDTLRSHPGSTGAAVGALFGVADGVFFTWLGVKMTWGGHDVGIWVLTFFTASYAGFGYVCGRLWEARRRIRAQLEALADTQARALQAEKLASLGRVAAGVAHEVRNPLGVIRSSAELLTDMAGADPDAADAGRFIVEEVDRLDGLVRSILDFSRPLAPERADTALSEVVRRAARLADRPTEVEGDAAAAVDPDLLVQAVLTMLVNARQAGAERVVARIRGGGRSWPSRSPTMGRACPTRRGSGCSNPFTPRAKARAVPDWDWRWLSGSPRPTADSCLIGMAPAWGQTAAARAFAWSCRWRSRTMRG
jgi:hypothetical protein